MTTEFLLGGGMAFLLALLGWSDQIRGVQERTRAHERDFLASHKIRWQDLRSVVRPSEHQAPKDRLLGVLKLLKQGVVASEVDVELLRRFESVDADRTELERAYAWRYWIIFASSVVMFVCGALSMSLEGPLTGDGVLTWAMLYSIATLWLVATILTLTAYIAAKESAFRAGLNGIEDALRTANQLTSSRGA